MIDPAGWTAEELESGWHCVRETGEAVPLSVPRRREAAIVCAQLYTVEATLRDMGIRFTRLPESPPASWTVLDVRGMLIGGFAESAVDTAAGGRANILYESRCGPAASEGTVLEQRPDPGTELEATDEVWLVFASTGICGGSNGT